MSSKHFDALEALFDSIEEEVGAAAGPKTCDALGQAREALRDREEEDLKDPS